MSKYYKSTNMYKRYCAIIIYNDGGYSYTAKLSQRWFQNYSLRWYRCNGCFRSSHNPLPKGIFTRRWGDHPRRFTLPEGLNHNPTIPYFTFKLVKLGIRLAFTAFAEFASASFWLRTNISQIMANKWLVAMQFSYQTSTSVQVDSN